MKTIKLLFFYSALFLFVKHANAAQPLSTFTLTNPCMPQVTITPITNTYGCFSITAYNGILNDPDAYYQWHFQDGTTGTGKTIYHCCSPVTVATNYTLSLTYINPNIVCVPMSYVQVFNVTLNPPAATQCIYNTASFSLAVNSVTVWAGITIPEIFTSFAYGDNSQSTFNNMHTYPGCGNYIIKVSQWDMNNPNDTCFAYAAVNIACSSPTGIKNNYQKTIATFYPNPAKEVLNIKAALPFNSIKIYNILGKEVLVYHEPQSNESKINIEGLLSGTYFVKMQFENGERATIKFIKE